MFTHFGRWGEEIGRTDGLNDTNVMVAVATSCVLGLGISFFGLNTRLALSATAFTVLGCGLQSSPSDILRNMAVWHHHAPHPLPWLLLALSGWLFYQRVTWLFAVENRISNQTPCGGGVSRGRGRCSATLAYRSIHPERILHLPARASRSRVLEHRHCCTEIVGVALVSRER